MTVWGIIFFIIAICVVIFVHELGHLITAKMFNVYCHEFSVGMGPKIKTMFVDKTGTEYNLRLIPLGGFVQIAGEEIDKELDKDIPKDQKLDNKKWWQRIIILFAGTFNNMLLCLLIMIILSVTNTTPTLFNGLLITESSNFFQAIVNGCINFWNLVSYMFISLGYLLTHGLQNASGLIGIADVANQASQQSLGFQLFFVAFISLNIGIANQLPIPMLDGGRIVLVLYEVIFRRKVNKTVENILMYGSLAILVFIFIATGYFDLKRIFNW